MPNGPAVREALPSTAPPSYTVTDQGEPERLETLILAPDLMLTVVQISVRAERGDDQSSWKEIAVRVFDGSGNYLAELYRGGSMNREVLPLVVDTALRLYPGHATLPLHAEQLVELGDEDIRCTVKLSNGEKLTGIWARMTLSGALSMTPDSEETDYLVVNPDHIIHVQVAD